jgi:putative aldouronate transport system permease protein
MRARGSSEIAYQVVIHVVVLGVIVASILPLLYVVGISLTTQPELIRRGFFVLIPEQPTIEAYVRVLGSELVWRSLLVSGFRTVVGTLLTLTLTVVGAYVLARKTLPGRRILLVFVLATILFNGGLIPTYLVMRDLSLLDNIWVMVLPLAVDSFGLLIIKVFIENLPSELIDAARIDGANEIQLLVRVIVPLAAPAIAAIGMFTIVAHWVSWFDALVYLQDQNLYPLQLVLRNMLTNDSSANDQMNFVLRDAQQINTETLKMATVVVAIIPILCIYPFLRKHFVKGVYLGSIK